MALFAHLALQNHNILPSDFMAFPLNDRAVIVASDIISAESAKKRFGKFGG